jgi:hypothetical protein
MVAIASRSLLSASPGRTLLSFASSLTHSMRIHLKTCSPTVPPTAIHLCSALLVNNTDATVPHEHLQQVPVLGADIREGRGVAAHVLDQHAQQSQPVTSYDTLTTTVGYRMPLFRSLLIQASSSCVTHGLRARKQSTNALSDLNACRRTQQLHRGSRAKAPMASSPSALTNASMSTTPGTT